MHGFEKSMKRIGYVIIAALLIGVAGIVFDIFELAIFGGAAAFVLSRLRRLRAFQAWLLARSEGTDRATARAVIDELHRRRKTGETGQIRVVTDPKTGKAQVDNGARARASADINAKIKRQEAELKERARQFIPQLDSHSVPGILLKRHWPLTAAAPGASHLGGLPHLPPGIGWPVHGETGVPLHHLAQIDLSDMPTDDLQDGLPRNGTLWFFASIDEELDWNTGGDTPHSAVLYAPGSASNHPPTTAPDTLPAFYHTAGEMTASRQWRSKTGPVARRWPVTGHAIPTWSHVEAPEGFPAREFFAAFTMKTKELRSEILGEASTAEPPERDRVFGSEFVAYTLSNGSNLRTRLTTYAPGAAGGRFPYNTALARRFLEGMAEELLHLADERAAKAERHRKSGTGPHPEDAGMAEEFARLAETARAGASRFGGPGRATTEADCDAMDALIGEYLETSRRWVEALTSGAPDAQRYAMAAHSLPATLHTVWKAATYDALVNEADRPDGAKGLPDGLWRWHANLLLPSHHYTHHMLFGAKGSASNPTEGTGIRLAQFDSDGALGWMFCDVGIVDFWISPEDLAAGRWDRAWAATAGG